MLVAMLLLAACGNADENNNEATDTEKDPKKQTENTALEASGEEFTIDIVAERKNQEFQLSLQKKKDFLKKKV